MSDIKLTYSGQSGDLDLTAHRLRLVSGLDAIEQQVRIRLKTFLGEWFLDEKVGIPYFREVLRKNPDLELVSSIFRKAIETVPGISSVDSLEVELIPSSRTLNIAFTATMDNGAELSYEPFVIEL